MSDEMAMVMDLLWAAARNDDATVEERRVEMNLLAGASPLAEGTVGEAVDIDGVPGEWLRPSGSPRTVPSSTCTAAATSSAWSSATGRWPARWRRPPASRP